jgi:hypothetical protein
MVNPLTLILSPQSGRGDVPSPFPRERVRVRVSSTISHDLEMKIDA